MSRPDWDTIKGHWLARKNQGIADRAIAQELNINYNTLAVHAKKWRREITQESNNKLEESKQSDQIGMDSSGGDRGTKKKKGLEDLLDDAIETWGSAVRNEEVSTQAVQTAKAILVKHGLLDAEDADAKFKVYEKMSDAELAMKLRECQPLVESVP